MGCSLAVLVGPRGSLLLLTHVEARIRSRPFIVDGGPTSSTSACTRACILGVCIRFAPEGRERSEVRHVLVALVFASRIQFIHRVAFCGVIAPAGRSSRRPSRRERTVTLAIRYRGQCDAYGSSGATCRPVRGLWMANETWSPLGITSSVTSRILDRCRACTLRPNLLTWLSSSTCVCDRSVSIYIVHFYLT